MMIRKEFSAVCLSGMILSAAAWIAGAAEPAAHAPAGKKVYGEWRILIKPDKGQEYNALIKSRGLPLFRQAGGRMVGWWNTLIGDLYEQVTIWEYDDMAAFERAIELLSNKPTLREFVALRDPLLSGEQSRFLRLAPGAEPPLPAGPVHISSFTRSIALRRSKFRTLTCDSCRPRARPAQGQRLPPGRSLEVEMGRWTEVTYLFRFESLAERERLIANVLRDPDAKVLRRGGQPIRRGDHDAAPRSRAVCQPPAGEPRPSRRFVEACCRTSKQWAPGVYVAGFADRYRSANCGWVRLSDETLLIDLPRGVPVPEFLAMVGENRGQARPDAGADARRRPATNRDLPALLDKGITRVLTSPGDPGALLRRMAAGVDRLPIERAFAGRTPIGDSHGLRRFLPLDGVAGQAGAAIELAGPGGAVRRPARRATARARRCRQRHRAVG